MYILLWFFIYLLYIHLIVSVNLSSPDFVGCDSVKFGSVDPIKSPLVLWNWIICITACQIEPDQNAKLRVNVYIKCSRKIQLRSQSLNNLYLPVSEHVSTYQYQRRHNWSFSHYHIIWKKHLESKRKFIIIYYFSFSWKMASNILPIYGELPLFHEWGCCVCSIKLI